MPRPKKTEEQVSEEVEPVSVVEEVKEKKPSLCGHENKHVYGTDGRLTSLFCDKPKGHEGDHHAIFQKNEPVREYDEKGRIKKTTYDVVDDDAYWNNAAGVEVKKITEGDATQLTQYQLDIVADIMKKNPLLTTKQAYAAAKATEAWR